MIQLIASVQRKVSPKWHQMAATATFWWSSLWDRVMAVTQPWSCIPVELGIAATPWASCGASANPPCSWGWWRAWAVRLPHFSLFRTKGWDPFPSWEIELGVQKESTTNSRHCWTFPLFEEIPWDEARCADTQSGDGSKLLPHPQVFPWINLGRQGHLFLRSFKKCWLHPSVMGEK